MPNIELLEATLAEIKGNPLSWNQGDWRCGSSYCYAGHAALLSGWRPVEGDKVAYWRRRGHKSLESALAHYQGLASRYPSEEEYYLDQIQRLDDLVENRNPWMVRGAETTSVDVAATEALGIDGRTALVLFESSNTLKDLEEMVEAIKENGYLEPKTWEWRVQDQLLTF